MGWIWKDDGDDVTSFDGVTSPRSANQCSTRRIVKSQCRTEEVEHGKFIRKCKKTDKLLKDCVGRSETER